MYFTPLMSVWQISPQSECKTRRYNSPGKRCRTHPAGPPQADGGIPQLQYSPNNGGYRGLIKTFSAPS